MYVLLGGFLHFVKPFLNTAEKIQFKKRPKVSGQMLASYIKTLASYSSHMKTPPLFPYKVLYTHTHKRQ